MNPHPHIPTPLRRLTSILVALTLLPVAAALSAQPAEAATPNCTKMVQVYANQTYVEVPAASGGNQNCILKQGSSADAAVEALQWALSLCYGADLGSAGIDGEFGSATFKALKKAQQYEKDRGNYGGTVDGIYGKNTRNALKFGKVRSAVGVFKCGYPADI